MAKSMRKISCGTQKTEGKSWFVELSDKCESPTCVPVNLQHNHICNYALSHNSCSTSGQPRGIYMVSHMPCRMHYEGFTEVVAATLSTPLQR